MRKMCKDCAHREVCGSPHTENTMGCDYWIAEGSYAEATRCKDCAIPHNCWIGCPKLGGLVTPPDFFCAFGTKEWNYEKT